VHHSDKMKQKARKDKIEENLNFKIHFKTDKKKVRSKYLVILATKFEPF
jgi:hypothetical protein